MKTITVHAVEMVRKIRDQQADKLANKTPEEIIAFFRHAGRSTLQTTGVRRRKRSANQSRGRVRAK
ncbi:MAG: hypothetical protein M5R38_05830 [Candidatus Methylomirabilis sp.]|nr:hypothetical protein [Candidatus Methylomirabilis sp.]